MKGKSIYVEPANYFPKKLRQTFEGQAGSKKTKKETGAKKKK